MCPIKTPIKPPTKAIRKPSVKIDNKTNLRVLSSHHGNFIFSILHRINHSYQHTKKLSKK